jgi:hypothetical protein
MRRSCIFLNCNETEFFQLLLQPTISYRVRQWWGLGRALFTTNFTFFYCQSFGELKLIFIQERCIVDELFWIHGTNSPSIKPIKHLGF